MKEKQIKQEIKNVLLDTEVSDVFVVQNSKKRAYIEQFKHKGVNFTQKKLGTFLGFFIVRDSSVSSANIVNFLTAEIKKEYFAFPKRGIAESFETALHRVNRALAEVANIGNVDWLGTIDGAVCAMDETMMYFSVTGEAVVLLMRGENIMNISEGIASDEAKQHPLKTFVDISNGQLAAGDKIIITSPELLDLISLDELQRNALRLGRDNFVQFVNTVLTNECKMAVATVIDVNEKTVPVVETNRSIKQEMGEESLEEMAIPNNVFSAQVFEAEAEGEEVNEVTVNEEVESMDEIEEKEEYTDKRTGHIYLQGDEGDEETNQLWSSITDFFKDAIRNIKEGTKKKFRRGKKKVKKLIDSRKTESKIQVDSAMPADVDYEIAKLKEELGVKNKKKQNKRKKKTDVIKINVIQEKKEKVLNSNERGSKENNMDLVKKHYQSSSKSELIIEKEDNSIIDKVLDFLEKIIDLGIALIKKIYKSILNGFSKVFAEKNKNKNVKISKNERSISSGNKKTFNLFANLKKIWQNVGGKNQIIGLTIVALILVVPLFFLNKENVVESNDDASTNEIANNGAGNSVDSNVENSNSAPTATAIEAEVEEFKIEGNINDPEEMYKGVALIYTDKMNEYRIAVTKDSVIVLDDENIKYSLPNSSGIVKYATVMDDLNLVFLLTDKNKLFSFSPISKEFESQNLNVEGKKVRAIDTYMTYLYVVAEDGITKHTRKESGFDDGKDWLKEEFETNKVDDISIKEKIYLSANGEIKVLISGKRKDFELENEKKVDLIYAKSSQNLWAINKEKATVYKFNRFSGKLLDEFVHNDIKDAVSFVVDEKTNVAIVSTSDGVFEFKLKKK